MTRQTFKLDDLSKPKAKSKTAALTEKKRAELLKKNWGEEAYKTIMRFRRIWDKEGAKLVP